MTTLSVETHKPRVITAPTLTPPATRTTEYSRAGHFLVHFSDTHLLAGDEGLYDGLPSDDRLAEALRELEDSGAHPDAIIFTGDLADLGERGAYEKLRRIVEPVADRLGTELVWLVGNHDDRASFRASMLGEAPSYAPADDVYNISGLRVIALDSTVQGHHYGEVTFAQREWLRTVLATPAEFGTILAMHHPPVPSVLELAAAVELRDQALLADVLRGSDVRTIIAGHLHYSSNATFAGIPVSVASATCYTQDLTAPYGSTRPRDSAQAFNLVHVYDETIVHSVVPVGQGPALKFVSFDESARMLAADGIVLRA
jgi:Icc protein